MALPVRQQWSLRRMEYTLHRSDPDLANLMRNFAKFALTGSFPSHEHLKPKALWRCQVIIGAALGLALLGAYAVQRWCRAVRHYFDLNKEALPKETDKGKRPGSVDAS